MPAKLERDAVEWEKTYKQFQADSHRSATSGVVGKGLSRRPELSGGAITCVSYHGKESRPGFRFGLSVCASRVAGLRGMSALVKEPGCGCCKQDVRWV